VGTATYCTGGSQQVPPADGEDLFAEEMFGQGHISMCPLTMASVAATVDTGSFKQPILLPGQQQIPATQLPAGVDGNLQTLMRDVVKYGTASTLKGISPTLGAKTGSAETDPKSKTDSWMVAFDPTHDIAVAALVQNGGFGNSAAGPAIALMLHKIGIG
jgi:cell division protein FtsI/penicillin-binding protein 2